MNAKELEIAQHRISAEIDTRAKELGFDNYPITDGVCDFEGYLMSNPKVMWILKEPNGQKEDGSLEKGGWSIPGWSFKDDIEGVAKQKTWQIIIYVMFGYLHGYKCKDMDYIRDNHQMAKVLQNIAYINVSKMPGYNTSSDSVIEQYYTQWKPILNLQIETYSPDIIIFGNTFKHFKKDFKELKKIYNFPNWIDVYKSGNRLLFDAYHPSRKGQEYVDTLISALEKYYPITQVSPKGRVNN